MLIGASILSYLRNAIPSPSFTPPVHRSLSLASLACTSVSEVTCSTLILPICISGKTVLINFPKSSLVGVTSAGSGMISGPSRIIPLKNEVFLDMMRNHREVAEEIILMIMQAVIPMISAGACLITVLTVIIPPMECP